MKIVEGIQRLSYSPSVAFVIKSLGLRGLARKVYGRAYRLPRQLTYSLGNIHARFQAQDALELRILEGTWLGEQNMLRGVLSKLAPGDVFLDGGSNLGLFTVFAAQTVGPQGVVYAFEPEDTAHGRLVENVRLNNLTNVKVFKKALSNGRGNRKLLADNSHGVSQSARVSEDGEGGESIETVDFDWLVDEQKLSLPAVIKLDVEGHEYAVLQGMRRSICDPGCVAMFCEVHPMFLPENVNTEMVLNSIASSGFTVVSKTERAKRNLHIIADKKRRQVG
jgi:FkbM family methyltransferase